MYRSFVDALIDYQNHPSTAKANSVDVISNELHEDLKDAVCRSRPLIMKNRSYFQKARSFLEFLTFIAKKDFLFAEKEKSSDLEVCLEELEKCKRRHPTHYGQERARETGELCSHNQASETPCASETSTQTSNSMNQELALCQADLAACRAKLTAHDATLKHCQEELALTQNKLGVSEKKLQYCETQSQLYETELQNLETLHTSKNHLHDLLEQERCHDEVQRLQREIVTLQETLTRDKQNLQQEYKNRWITLIQNLKEKCEEFPDMAQWIESETALERLEPSPSDPSSAKHPSSSDPFSVASSSGLRDAATSSDTATSRDAATSSDTAMEPTTYEALKEKYEMARLELEALNASKDRAVNQLNAQIHEYLRTIWHYHDQGTALIRHLRSENETLKHALVQTTPHPNVALENDYLRNTLHQIQRVTDEHLRAYQKENDDLRKQVSTFHVKLSEKPTPLWKKYQHLRTLEKRTRHVERREYLYSPYRSQAVLHTRKTITDELLMDMGFEESMREESDVEERNRAFEESMREESDVEERNRGVEESMGEVSDVEERNRGVEESIGKESDVEERNRILQEFDSLAEELVLATVASGHAPVNPLASGLIPPLAPGDTLHDLCHEKLANEKKRNDVLRQEIDTLQKLCDEKLAHEKTLNHTLQQELEHLHQLHQKEKTLNETLRTDMENLRQRLQECLEREKSLNEQYEKELTRFRELCEDDALEVLRQDAEDQRRKPHLSTKKERTIGLRISPKTYRKTPREEAPGKEKGAATTLQKDLQTLQKDYATLREQCATLKKDHQTLQKDYATLQERFATLTHEHENLHNQHQSLVTENENLRHHHTTQGKDLVDLKNQIQAYRQTNNELHRQIEHVEKNLTLKTADFHKLQEAYSALESQAQEYDQAYNDLLAKKTELETQLQSFRRTVAQDAPKDLLVDLELILDGLYYQLEDLFTVFQVQPSLDYTPTFHWQEKKKSLLSLLQEIKHLSQGTVDTLEKLYRGAEAILQTHKYSLDSLENPEQVLTGLRMMSDLLLEIAHTWMPGKPLAYLHQNLVARLKDSGYAGPPLKKCLTEDTLLLDMNKVLAFKYFEMVFEDRIERHALPKQRLEAYLKNIDFLMERVQNSAWEEIQPYVMAQLTIVDRILKEPEKDWRPSVKRALHLDKRVVQLWEDLVAEAVQYILEVHGRSKP